MLFTQNIYENKYLPSSLHYSSSINQSGSIHSWLLYNQAYGFFLFSKHYSEDLIIHKVNICLLGFLDMVLVIEY